jgi:hypothetical protein
MLGSDFTSMTSKVDGLHSIYDAARRIDHAVTDQPKETNDFAREPCRREQACSSRRLSMLVRDIF